MVTTDMALFLIRSMLKTKKKQREKTSLEQKCVLRVVHREEKQKQWECPLFKECVLPLLWTVSTLILVAAVQRAQLIWDLHEDTFPWVATDSRENGRNSSPAFSIIMTFGFLFFVCPFRCLTIRVVYPSGYRMGRFTRVSITHLQRKEAVQPYTF